MHVLNSNSCVFSISQIIFEIMDILQPSLRWFNWKFDLFAMLLLLIFVIPFNVSFLVAASFRQYDSVLNTIKRDYIVHMKNIRAVRSLINIIIWYGEGFCLGELAFAFWPVIFPHLLQTWHTKKMPSIFTHFAHRNTPGGIFWCPCV